MNIWIPGEPKAQPRPKVRVIPGTKPRGHVYTPEAKTKPWRESIRTEFGRLPEDQLDELGSVESFYVALWFHLQRPKTHYRAGKFSHLLKKSSPIFHASKPDVDNLAKLVLDEMQGLGAISDDSRVVRLTAVKTWSMEPGCLVILEPLGDLNDLHTIEAIRDNRKG